MFSFQKLGQTPKFYCQTKLKQCYIYRADSSGQISVWHTDLKQFSANKGKLDHVILMRLSFPSVDVYPTWSVSYKDIWNNALANTQTIGKVLNNVNHSMD